MAVLGGRSQVGLVKDVSVGNLVPSGEDQRNLGGSAINNQTAPYPALLTNAAYHLFCQSCQFHSSW